MATHIAYLGPEGTFSHLVSQRRFPKGTLLACPTVTDVFGAIKEGSATLGIVPIENSSGGTITDTVDLLIEHAAALRVREELALDVRLALLGHPGQSISSIRSLYSHTMPLRHHREWIRVNLPGAELVEASSTAEAARLASGRTSAALAAPGAAGLYGLSVLKFPVRPEALNVTHFFVIARSGERASSLPAKRCKTSLVAALPQTSGSLHRFLGPFARAQVNLCRIVSRPVPGHPETYVFYLEIEGTERESRVAKALAGARRLSSQLQSLGSYPCRLRYRSV